MKKQGYSNSDIQECRIAVIICQEILIDISVNVDEEDI